MSEPTHGYTSAGHAVHAHTWHHLPQLSAAQRVNSRVAVMITRSVGTMWCAYAFCALALVSAPAAFASGNAVTIVGWISQTLLQLTLLSVIMVGQDVQACASDARSAKTFEDVERILDALDLETEGGLKAIYDLLSTLAPKPIVIAFPESRKAPEA
jgi:hypothetical protein